MWEILGITATHDIKKIKRAYARMLAKYHPEDHPEKFLQIQEAYEYAITYAKNANINNYEVSKNIFFEKSAGDQEDKTEDFQREKITRKIIFEKAAENQEEKIEDFQTEKVQRKIVFKQEVEEKKEKIEDSQAEKVQRKIIFEQKVEDQEEKIEDFQTEKVQRKIVFEQEVEDQEDKSEETQTDQIPDYIKKVTIEKNEDIIREERKLMNQYINNIVESLRYKKRSDVLKIVEFLNTDEFNEIASKKEFYKDLARELKRNYTGNVIVLKSLKSIYENMNFLDNEDFNINIVALLEERIKLIEETNNKNIVNLIKKTVQKIAIIGILCFFLVGFFWDSIKLHYNIPDENEICSLIKAQYGVDISPENIYDEDDINVILELTAPSEKNYSRRIYYTTNEGNLIFFNSLYKEDIDSSIKTKFNFEDKLFKEYLKKYLKDYIYKDYAYQVEFSDSYCVMDDELFIMEFYVSGDRIDSFIDSFYEFKEAYWSEIPVNSRNTEYQFTVHYGNLWKIGVKHEQDDVVIKLSSKNADLDKEAVRKKIEVIK